MTRTQHRNEDWQRVMGADDEKIWAFGGVVEESPQNGDAAAGAVTVSGTAVPAGEIWVITHVTGRDITHAATTQSIVCAGLATFLTLAEVAALAAGLWLIWDGWVVLQAGDQVTISFTGVTLHDVLQLRYCGYKMTVP